MSDKRHKIIIAVTGASGSIYARLLIERLLSSPQVERIALIASQNGRAVSEYENVRIPTPEDDPRIETFNNGDMFSDTASGSSSYDAMVVIPCSMGAVGRIANGISSDLISRSADVMLKERRMLVMAVRETPLSLIHLRNLTILSQAGATIVPASPSFYSHPRSIEQLCMTVVERIISLLGIDLPHYSWEDKRNYNE